MINYKCTWFAVTKQEVNKQMSFDVTISSEQPSLHI